MKRRGKFGFCLVLAIAATAVSGRLLAQGTAMAWGSNGNGQLGNGTRTSSNTPTPVSNMTGVVALAGGGFHSLALKGDGTVWGWGYGYNGQLGSGTLAGDPNAQTAPVQANISGVAAIAAGLNHSLALRSDGTVAGFGYNGQGQLGTGTTTPINVNSPVPVALTGARVIAAGTYHSLAAKTDGTAWTWGRNAGGQLGDGTIQDRSSPVQVPLSNVIGVAGGDLHSLALKDDGTVWAWGDNAYGQLGNGTLANSVMPVQVTITGVVALASGQYHGLALKGDGTVWIWGRSPTRVGDRTDATPVMMSGVSDVVAIVAGGFHSLALKRDGTIWAWGLNVDGQLGNGTDASTNNSVSTVPVMVSGLAGVTAFGAGQYYSLAATNPVPTNVPPVIGGIAGPNDPAALGGTTTVTASFTDANAEDTHTCTFAWGDSGASAGTVRESAGSGSCSATHVYGAVGVYRVSVTVTDSRGATATGSFEYAVVYDPNGGFVTGGGWIQSPAGAYSANPSLIGRANFGLVSQYKAGATVPSGDTQFQFQVANLNFKSTAYEWLVISGARAQYKGSGTINGAGGYSFLITAVDGAIPGGGGHDKFRMKIWDSRGVFYDNQMGNDDNAEPTTLLDGGSIVIHKP